MRNAENTARGGGYLARSFAYRRLYVDAVLERAPRRAVLAVWSEVWRLAFVVVGSALVALIFWLLAAGAYARDGLLAAWTLAAGLCALAATLGALIAFAEVLRARRDLARVRAAVAAEAAEGPA